VVKLQTRPAPRPTLDAGLGCDHPMLSGFCRRELGVGFHCLMLSLNPRIEVISVEFVNAQSILLWRSLSPCVRYFGGTLKFPAKYANLPRTAAWNFISRDC
jgi:hypothetical protein